MGDAAFQAQDIQEKLQRCEPSALNEAMRVLATVYHRSAFCGGPAMMIFIPLAAVGHQVLLGKASVFAVAL
jgi:hypothetical protein